jgi:hypothetical protein
MGLGTIISMIISICLIIIFGTGLAVFINGVKAFTGSMDIAPGIFPTQVAQIIYRIWSYIFMVAVLVFGLTSMFLIIVFILWMIIKYIVPKWILFIPIRKILLEITPFPELTKSGILPLMERLINVFGGAGTLFQKLGISGQAIVSYLFTATKYVFQKIVPNYNPDIVSSKTKELSGGKMDLENDPSDKKEYKKENYENYDTNEDMNAYYRKTLLAIDNQKINCMRSKRKEIKPYFSLSELAAVKVYNTTVAIQCESEAIVGNIKASFTKDI